MERLQSQVTVLLFLMLLPGCGEDRREEVAERYSTGEKKEIRVYEGEGTEEELIKRQFYAQSGELIRVENEAKGDTLYYGDLKPELTAPEGLEEYLTGGAWAPGKESSLLAIQFTSDSVFVVDGSVEEVEDASIAHIEYLPGDENSNMYWPGNELGWGESRPPVGKILQHMDSGMDTLWVYPMGPDSLVWKGLIAVERVNRDVRQAARKYRRQQQRFETASQKVTLSPRGNQMKYDQDEFTVPAGETVQLAYENTATSPSMRHNVIVLNVAPGSSIYREVGQAAVKAGTDDDYAPDHPAVLAATPISKPGERVSVTFKTPEEPGTYGFVCTYPGHWATGQGTMQVVPE